MEKSPHAVPKKPHKSGTGYNRAKAFAVLLSEFYELPAYPVKGKITARFSLEREVRTGNMNLVLFVENPQQIDRISRSINSNEFILFCMKKYRINVRFFMP